jgi:PKD repeat protein
MISYTTEVTIDNVAPVIDSTMTPNGDEGSILTYISTASDQGSDDLTFTWKWGDGTSDVVTIYYNNGVSPEPEYNQVTNEIKSPWGTFPFSATDTVDHTYGDNGVYTVTLTIEDDDGGSITYIIDITIDNVAPTITPFGSFTMDEGSNFDYVTISSDPGSDDLTFTWVFELGPTFSNIHYNDGVGPEPEYDPVTNEIKSPWGTFPFSVEDMVSHAYGDDGIYTITLTVEDDDGGTDTYATTVTINNVAPTIENVEAYILLDFTMRATGEKWHNVEMFVLTDDVQIAYAEIVRYPGNPDDQTVTLYDVKCDVTKVIVVKLLYTPDDDPVNGQPNGATPLWLTIGFDDGHEDTFKHTFNVQHPETWEWNIRVNEYIVGHEITFESDATDPGSDDLTFTWDWDDGTPFTSAIYYNDGMGPDPYPSPNGIFPVSQFDQQGHIFTTNGNYNVQLTVNDDDGGVTVVVITVLLI